nr:hypothetical protein [Tanacetum cinerariifolium]
DSVLVDQRFLDDENLRGSFTVVDNYHLYMLYFPHDVPDVVSFFTTAYVIHRPPGLYRPNFTFYASDWAVVLVLVYFLLPDPRAFVLGASVYSRTMLVDGYRFVTWMPLPHELTDHLHLFQSMHGRVVNSVFYIFDTTHGKSPLIVSHWRLSLRITIRDSVLVDQRFLDDENLRGSFTVVDNYHLYTLYFPHDVPDVVSFFTTAYVIHRPSGLYRHNFTFYASDWAVELVIVYFLLPDPQAFILGASVYRQTMLVDGYRFDTRMPLPHELTHHLHLFQSMHGRVVNSIFYIFVTTHGTPPDQIQPVHYQPSVYIFRPFRLSTVIGAISMRIIIHGRPSLCNDHLALIFTCTVKLAACRHRQRDFRDSVLIDQRFLDDENLRGSFTVIDNYHLYTLYFPHDVPDDVSFFSIAYVIHRPHGLYRHNFTFYASDWAVVLVLVYFLLPDPRAFVLGASVYRRTMLVDGYRFVTRMPLPHELTDYLHLFQSMHGRVVNSVFYIFVTTHGTPPDQIQPVHYQPSV